MKKNNRNTNMFDDAIETMLKLALAPIRMLWHDMMNPRDARGQVKQGEYEQKPLPKRGPLHRIPSRFDAGGGEEEEEKYRPDPVETSPEEVAYRLAEIEDIEKGVAASFAMQRMEKAIQKADPMLKEIQETAAIQETIQGIQDLYEESCISYPR